MTFYLKELPDETVTLWTAGGRPVWTFTSIPEAIAGGIAWVGADESRGEPAAPAARFDTAA